MAKFKCQAEWADCIETMESDTAAEAAEGFCDLFYDPDDHDSQGDTILEVDVTDEDGQTTEIVVHINIEYTFKANQ